MIDISQRIEVQGFSGTIEELVKLLDPQKTLDDFSSQIELELWDWDDPGDVANYKELEELQKKAPNLWWDGWDGSEDYPAPNEDD